MAVRGGYGYPPAGGGRRQIRAADSDRDRVVALLNTAFSEGRLTHEEYDARLHAALQARTYADLDQMVADLPVAMPPMRAPEPETNQLALASLACGIAQLVFWPLATVPALVCGHMARSQIRRSGEKGAGLALAGLILGYGAIILYVVAMVALVALVDGAAHTVIVHAHSGYPGSNFPGPPGAGGN